MGKKNAQPNETAEKKAGLPSTHVAGAGMESLTSEDLIIPRLVLVQPTSQIDGVGPGKFYLNLTGEEFEQVDAVFLRVTKGRVYFAKESLEQKPLCGSPDRIKPSPRYEEPMAESCAECPYAQWFKKEPPACNETYNLLGVMVESGLPFWWSVKSSAMSPTKRYLSAIALRARQGKNLYDVQATMTSQLVTKPGKKYHVPAYALTWLKDSSPYQALYEQYAHEEIDRTFQAEETVSSNTENHEDFDWETGKEVHDE